MGPVVGGRETGVGTGVGRKDGCGVGSGVGRKVGSGVGRSVGFAVGRTVAVVVKSNGKRKKRKGEQARR